MTQEKNLTSCNKGILFAYDDSPYTFSRVKICIDQLTIQNSERGFILLWLLDYILMIVWCRMNESRPNREARFFHLVNTKAGKA